MTDQDRNHYIQMSYADDEEIDLKEVLRVLWAGKLLIAAITFAVTVIAVIIVLLLPNIYRAEALLAPNDHEAAGGLSTLAAQYGGLASLAGINIGSGSVDKTALGIEFLKSRKFIGEFIERHGVLVPLMAATAWDSVTGDLDIDPNDYDVASEAWVRNVRPPKKTIPSSQEAYEEFMDILSVRQDMNTGFVTVAIEYYSPTVAKQWVDWLIDDLNSSTMRQDVDAAEQAIEYLRKQIENTSLADLQNVFFRLIEEQTKTMMLANVSDEYLLITVDPAVAPEKKSKPKRSMIVILSAVFASFFAVAVVFVSTSLRQEITV